MAWSRLQSAVGSATAASSATATYGTNVSSGTKLIAAVAVSGNTPSITSVKDGAGNNLTQLALKANGILETTALYALDTPAGDVGTKPAITVTVTPSGACDVAILVQEVSGLLAGNTTAMADGTPGSSTGNNGASTGSPSYTSTASNEYLVAVYGDDGGPETYTKPAALTDDANSINASGANDISISFGNSTNGTEAGSYALTGTAADWALILGAFKLAAGGAAPFVPPPPARRLPYRTPALPPVRRYRSLLPVPAQLNPPFQFNETVQRRQTWPRGLPRRGRVTFTVPPQLNPPYPFTETVQRRQAWARGLPRRGRQVTPVPAQLNPPYPFAEIRQWRQPRGFWPFRGRHFEVVPPQQAAAPNPAFTWQPLRHARIMLYRRGRAPVVVPGQDAPVPQARRTRPVLPPRRPYRQTLPVPAQLNPPYPFTETVQRRETWARALLRRGRLVLPWPQAVQAPPPVLQDGDIAASVTEGTTTAATLAEGTTMTATVTDQASITSSVT